MGLVSELRRRNVFRVAIAYGVIAWVLAQVADLAFNNFGAPGWVAKSFLFVLVLGFPLALIFAWAFELTPEGIKLEKHVDRSKSITHLTGRKLDFYIIGVLTVALALFAFDEWVLEPALDAQRVQPTTEAEGEDAAAPIDEEPAANTIAVLPFANLSSDPEQEYFADGLAEEILLVLARVPDLVVAPRARAFAHKGENLNIKKIAAELGVKFVLAGTVRRAGNRVRVAVELIEVGNDIRLWSKSFEREFGDVFAIQEGIAEGIARSLEIRIADARGNPIKVAATNNSEAHNAYLKGRYLLHRRGAENVRQAIEYLQTATQLDPDYAEAHASLGIAKSIGWNQSDPKGAALSASRALILDDSLSMAWTAAGRAAVWNFRFEDAEKAFREALALEPNNAEATHFLAALLHDLGSPNEAFRLGLRAASLDPASALYRRNLAQYCMVLDRIEEGMSHLQEASEIDRNFGNALFQWKAMLGDSVGASQVLASGVVPLDSYPYYETMQQALILLTSGRAADARAILPDSKSLMSLWVRGDRPSIQEVFVFVVLEDFAMANWLLEELISDGYTMSDVRVIARIRPDLPFRKTRYNELRASIGLPGIDD